MSYPKRYPIPEKYAMTDSWDISQSPECIFIDDRAIEEVVPGYRTLNVSGRESLAYKITEDDRPIGMDGKEYYGRNLKGRTITVRFLLKRNTAQKFMESFIILKRMCSDSEELKLSFSDMPNKYYTGLLQKISEPDPGMLQIQGEMTFYCPDPHCYEDVITTVEAEPDWTGREFQSHLSAQIVNDGSAEVYPVYRIQNNSITSEYLGYTSQNSYIGIVHQGGALELGDPEENNSTEKYLFDIGLSNAQGSGWSRFVAVKDPSGATKSSTGSLKRIHPFDSRCASNGTLGIMQQKHLTTKCSDYYGLTIQESGSVNSDDLTYGGMRRCTLSDPAPDFYLWCEMQFVASKMGQVGILQLMLCDENNKFLAGFGCVKDDFAGNKARFVIWVGDDEFKKFEFETDSQKRKLNPFIDTGWEDIQKEGGKWRFYYGGKRYTTYVPEHANKSVKYIYIYCGRFRKKYITNHKSNDVNIYAQIIGRIRCNDQRSENWEMKGNRYDDADVVKIDCENDSITLNGLPANDELVTGSVFAPIPPSPMTVDKHGNITYEPITVDIYTSAWQEYAPTVTIEFRKRWL